MTKRTAKKTANVEAGAKAGQTTALRELAGIARDINAALDKAKVSDQRSFDLRLTAAQHLATAKAKCKVSKITFKAWCEENVKHSYDEAKKLAIVGEAKEPTKALEDLRAKAAQRNREARARNKVSASVSRASVGGPVRDVAPASSPALDAVKLLTSMDSAARARIVGEALSKDGLTTVPRDQAKLATMTAEEQIKAAWARIGPLQRREIFDWLARDLGAIVSWPKGLAVVPEGDPLDIPEFAKRTLPPKAPPIDASKVKSAPIAKPTAPAKKARKRSRKEG